MISRRSLIGSLLSLGALAGAPLSTMAAQSGRNETSVDPELERYIRLAPAGVASLDQAIPLSFGNAKLQMDTLGFTLPFDMGDTAALDNWIKGAYPVALPSVFLTNSLREEFSDLFGFHIGQVLSGAEFGEPPRTVSVLRGVFDAAHIRSVQEGLGYRSLDVDGHEVLSLSEDGGVSLDNPVQRLALARVNNSAFLDDDTLVYTPTLESMRMMLAPGATLADQPWVQQAIGGLSSPLIAAAVLGPGSFLPGLPPELLEPSSQEEIADFILSMQERDSAPIVLAAIAGTTAGGPLSFATDETPALPSDVPQSLTVFSLVYGSSEEAARAATQIEERLATGSSVVSKRPWTELFTSWSVLPAAAGSTVSLMLEWPTVPRTLDLIWNRDLGFITG